jgi:hypothetical protein
LLYVHDIRVDDIKTGGNLTYEVRGRIPARNVDGIMRPYNQSTGHDRARSLPPPRDSRF